ncbi:hypothetical protein GQ457_16G015200 [Hibiscus cannabinus]
MEHSWDLPLGLVDAAELRTPPDVPIVDVDWSSLPPESFRWLAFLCPVVMGSGAGGGAVGERWRSGLEEASPRASMIRQRAKYSSSVETWSKRGRLDLERLRLVNDSRQC